MLYSNGDFNRINTFGILVPLNELTLFISLTPKITAIPLESKLTISSLSVGSRKKKIFPTIESLCLP